MTTLKRMAVFCGSSSGTNERYSQQAWLLGTALAQQQIGVVYGAGNLGLMNSVSNGAPAYGGEVIGVIPTFLVEKELAHEKLTELICVESMHERKQRMSELCDGVIALPGGYGTMDEFFEMLTWAQLGLHHKPMGILNTNGFYNDLINLIQTMTREGFLKEACRDIILVSSHIPDLLEQMKAF